MSTPLKGESYSFGFCNQAAIIALYLALVVIWIGLLRGRKKSSGLSWFDSSPILFPPLQQAFREYLLLGFASVVAVAAVVAWNNYLVYPYWAESRYFLCRIDLVRLGYRPYADFQFGYGPLFLYAPIGLDWLSANRLGIENAYAWCVALAYPIGFSFLFVFLRLLDLPERHRSWILILALLVWFAMSMGLQYTPLRYTALACALAIGSHPLFSTRSVPCFWKMIVTAGCCAVCLTISPEMGIACAVGLAASAAVDFRAGRLFPATTALLGVGLTVALPPLFSIGYLHSIFSFGSGAYNFPFYPTLANVTLIAAALYVLPTLACAIWQEPIHPLAPFGAAIGMAAATLLPCAMGRCDPGHVLYNGLTIFILLFAALGRIKRSLMIGWGVLFGFCFVIMSQISYWKFYTTEWTSGVIDHEVYLKHPDLVRKWSQEWRQAGMKSKNYALMNWHKVAPYPEISEDLLHSSDTIIDPVGGGATLDRYCKIRDSFRPDYYPAVYPELFVPADVERAVSEIENNYDVWIMSKATLEAFRPALAHPPDIGQTRQMLSKLLLFPVDNVYRNKPYDPEAEVMRLLLQDCPRRADDGEYVLFSCPTHK